MNITGATEAVAVEKLEVVFSFLNSNCRSKFWDLFVRLSIFLKINAKFCGSECGKIGNV
jgi:hypothetical protein